MGELLAEAAARLAPISATPRLDAEILLAHAMGIEREELLMNPASLSLSKGCPASNTGPEIGQGFDKLSQAVLVSFEHLISCRLAHEPIAYITGTRGFWTIDLDVTPDVLIPRPDSETLIEAAVAHFGDDAPHRILDLGTGSGALLLAALDQWPHATGMGIDASRAALIVAQGNADRIAPGRAEMIMGSWHGTGETFDLILCNPPYIEDTAELPRDVRDWEPHSALFAGPDGLDAYRDIAPWLAGQMRPGGIACIEIGWTQAAAVTDLFAAQGFAVACRHDLAGRDRCLVVTRK